MYRISASCHKSGITMPATAATKSPTLISVPLKARPCLTSRLATLTLRQRHDTRGIHRYRAESEEASHLESSSAEPTSPPDSTTAIPLGEASTTAGSDSQPASASTSTNTDSTLLTKEDGDNTNNNDAQPLAQRLYEFTTDPERQRAALLGIAKAMMEVLRLTILIPLRYLVLTPLGWLFTRLGFASIYPQEVLARLEEVHATTPVTADKLASVLKSLGTKHPKHVVDFIETHCLNPPPASTTQPYPINAAVVRIYLSALVHSGKLKEYTDDVDMVPIPGASHTSLPLLLKELQTAAAGNGPMPLMESPGAAPARPLHVYVNGGVAGLGSSAPTGLLGTLQSWFWFFATCMMLSFAWTVGAAAVRRYSGGGSPSASAGAGIATSGMIGSNTPGAAGGMFGQKEYNKENMPEKSIKSFKDVKGCDEAVAELEEIVEYLKNPDKFTRLGGKLPKGVLLTGQPGTGKTLLARAVAGEAGVPFFYKAGSEFDEMFVGVGSRRVRNLFAAAKKKAPCIVFIDEIDAVGGKRSNWEASGGSRKTLNQLLTEMDGFEDNSGVVVMAATNLHEMLDSALTRPGRFDRQVAVPLPDINGRKQIVDLYLAGKPLAADVDAELIARRTPGFSGAQLFNLINEAALLAARYDAEVITADLLDEARDKVLMGSPRSLSQSEEARRLTAYHEGGHALVALYTKGAKPIHKATIVPRGHALGMVSQVPDTDEYSTTRQQMEAHIDVCMGGKAAEELIFGEEYVTSGATSDLKSATRLAKHMVEDCGMSDKIGPRAVDDTGLELRKVVDEEVTRLLKGAYTRVAKLLKTKEDELHLLAAALLEQETLTQQQIKELLWGKETAGTSEGETSELPVASSRGAVGTPAGVSAAARTSSSSPSS